MRVIIKYNKYLKENMPFQSKGGIILVISKGPGPRNILVKIMDKKIVIPKGNLFN